MDMPQGHKRVASSQTADSVTDDDDVRTPKRSRRMSGETYGVRNPIDVSYSSSRRWLQRKVSTPSTSRTARVGAGYSGRSVRIPMSSSSGPTTPTFYWLLGLNLYQHELAIKT